MECTRPSMSPHDRLLRQAEACLMCQHGGSLETAVDMTFGWYLETSRRDVLGNVSRDCWIRRERKQLQLHGRDNGFE